MKKMILMLSMVCGASSALAYAPMSAPGDVLPTQYISWCDQETNTVVKQNNSTGDIVVLADCNASGSVCTESVRYNSRANVVSASCQLK